MNIWIYILLFYQFILFVNCSDIFTKDFQLFSKVLCKYGCSSINCYPNTLISIDSVQKKQTSANSICNQSGPSYSSSQYNCFFKYFESHVFKTCSNTISCQICLDRIESEYLPNTVCTSEHDFEVKYRCIPDYIKNDNICANSYLDVDCHNRLNEKLVIINATLFSEISSDEDQRSCGQDNSQKKESFCRPVDKTSHVISKCSYRSKCSIGPYEFTSGKCRNMHMRLSHACVQKDVLYHFKKPLKDKFTTLNTLASYENESDSSSWFLRNKWTILGISVSIVVTSSVIISLFICINKRHHRQRSCDIQAHKDNLFNKLGQQKFSPPPSSIDKVNIEFENATLTPPDIYNCNSDNEDLNARSMYSSNIPNTHSYTSQFCNAPPSINTCQYFAPLLAPGHISMLEMPAVQLASSSNLTSSTMNSSHGTPRGTKSSGIFSMTDMSFENTHLV